MNHSGRGSHSGNGGRGGRGGRGYRWLALLPTVGIVGGVPFANRVRPFVLGLPFLLAWIVGWIVATSAIMALIYYLDNVRDNKRMTRV